MLEELKKHQIIVKDLHFSFFSGNEVLRGIDLEVEKGESLIILGENGSGKSTFFLNLLNLLPDFTGTIEINDKIVNRKNEKEIRKKIGLMFQDPNDQLFLPTVQQELEFGPSNLGITGEKLNSKIAQVIDILKLQKLIDKKTFHLSYGEKKKIAFASIFAMDPEIYLLDEPYANLDPKTKREFSEILLSLHNKKKTLIVISHDLDKIPKFIKRAVVLHEGRILFDGLINDLFKELDILEDANLDLPILAQLYNELNDEFHLEKLINFPRDIDELIKILRKNRINNQE